LHFKLIRGGRSSTHYRCENIDIGAFADPDRACLLVEKLREIEADGAEYRDVEMFICIVAEKIRERKEKERPLLRVID